MPGGTLWVEAEAFEDAAATARRIREPAAYRAAIELYAGELLPEGPYEEWAEGKAMILKEALGYALLEEERPGRPLQHATRETPQTGGQQLDTLTRRQREVALLIDRGLTNCQIAGGLSISERTVTTRVEHILARLGASFRAQVAARMAKQERLPEESPG